MTRKQKQNTSNVLYMLAFALENGKVEIGKDIDLSWIESAKELSNKIDKELQDPHRGEK